MVKKTRADCLVNEYTVLLRTTDASKGLSDLIALKQLTWGGDCREESSSYMLMQ